MAKNPDTTRALHDRRIGDVTLHHPAEYGDSCSAFYDQLYPTVEEGLVAALAELAGQGRALELGVATGRVALPLSAAGVEVHGVDASRSMIEHCRSRPGASDLHIVEADFAELPYKGSFDLVFALVSTLSLLPTRERLARCFASIAAALAPGGLFVYEVYVARDAQEARTADHPIRTIDGTRNYRMTTLDSSPATISRLAGLAGLQMREVWGNWKGDKAEAASARQIMIFRRCSDDSNLS